VNELAPPQGAGDIVVLEQHLPTPETPALRNKATWRDNIFAADALQKRTFRPAKFIVPAYIPEGLTILAGRPKLGKSWLTLDIAVAVAAGRLTLGKIEPSIGDVLLLALEDNDRRLQRRMDKLLGMFRDWPARLTFATTWRRLKEGGVDDIAEWCDSVSDPRLVVIDTFAKVRPRPTSRNGPTYDDDYRSLAELQRLANDRGIGIVVIHHVRKMDADDPLDTVSGTMGLTAAADTILVLDRRSDTGMTLYGRGRDIEEIEVAIAFEKETCRWSIRGRATDVRRSDERGRILGALEEAGEPMSPADISLVTGMPKTNVRQLLLKMVRGGEVEKSGRGQYVLPPTGIG
jgi:AAA domain/IclR helix-turn-helix domain